VKVPINMSNQTSISARIGMWGWSVLLLLMNAATDTALCAQVSNNAPQNNPLPNQVADDTAGQLPDNFKPPGKIPEVMTLSKELLKPEEHKEFAVIRRDYLKALRNGNLSGKSKKHIEDGIRYRVYHLADVSERNHLQKVTAELLRDIQYAGRILNKQNEIERFREFVLSEVVKRCNDLLDNNFYVRVQAVIILSHLNLTNERINPKPEIPEQAFTPAAEPLLNVINDPDQFVSLRVIAVGGLKHIAWLGDPNNELKLRMASSLIREVSSKKNHWWYQMRICEALGSIDLETNPAGDPIIVQTLMSIMLDKDRHWRVRSAAAEALGRAPLDPKLDVSLINHKICEFIQEVALAYNQNLDAFYWKRCWTCLYLAYQPLDKKDQDRLVGLVTKANQANLSPNTKKEITDAYQKLFPVFVSGIKSAPGGIPANQIKDVNDWITKNQPQGNSLAPGLPPISKLNEITGAPIR